MSGKDGGWLLPAEIDPDRVCVRLNIPNDPAHISAFWGALWLLTYWNQWQRDPLQRGRQAAAVWKDVWFEAKAINQDLEGCEIMPFDVRQNSQSPCLLEKTEDNVNWVTFANLRLCTPLVRIGHGGGLEVSNDDGQTWQPTEAAPPPSRDPAGTNNRCLAAANAVNVLVTLHYEVASNISVPSGLALAAIIAGLLISIFFAPFATAVILAILAGGALATFQAVPFGAFTTEVRDELLCILYCNSSEDTPGVVTFDYDSIRSQIAPNIVNLNIWEALDYYLQIVGADGLNRAGATTEISSATCDCPDCDPAFALEAWAADGAGTVVESLGVNPQTGWQRFRATGQQRGTDTIISLVRTGGGCFRLRQFGVTYLWNNTDITQAINGVFTASVDCNGATVQGYNIRLEQAALNGWSLIRWSVPGNQLWVVEFDAEPI